MDCRETRMALIAFHDGELPDADRGRVEAHLRDCPACRALLADLARADEAAGVPDPGPEYWERFNARVMDRVETEADGAKVVVLRPKQGWMRHQLRYLVPAVAAAALVVVVVRHSGVDRVEAPTPVSAPATLREIARPEGAVPSPVESPPKDQAVPRPDARRLARPAGEPVSPPPSSPSYPAEGRATTASPGASAQSTDSVQAVAPTLASSQAFKEVAQFGMQAGLRAAKSQSDAGEAKSKAGASGVDAAPARPDSPCQLARKLAAQGRLKEAEAAQRACLAREQAPTTQETGLVFLAELLDRQARFAEADTVIEETRRQFPRSRPLDLYRQQRPLMQRQSPVSR